MTPILSGLLVLACGGLLTGAGPGGWPGGANRRLRVLNATDRRAGFRSRAGSWFRAAGPRHPTVGSQPPLNLALVASEVAALLRAGASPQQAWWDSAQIRVDQSGIPVREDLVIRIGGSGRGSAQLAGAEQQATGVLAACSLAGQIGAPLAPVLETVGRSVVQAQESRTEREAALAGPRSTARLLSWLPLVGFGLALALGANPLGFLFGSIPGLLAGVMGATLIVVGHRWSARLFDGARRAGGLE